MPTLPTTVQVAKLPFYLPNGLPVWANDIALDLVVQADQMHVELCCHFDAVNAKLIERSGLYSDLRLPANVGGSRVLTLTLVARPALCAQYHALFRAAEDPVATFVAGPKPEGAPYAPLLALANYERRALATEGDDGDDELESFLDMDFDNI